MSTIIERSEVLMEKKNFSYAWGLPQAHRPALGAPWYNSASTSHLSTCDM
jgi:hypothetical protein